MDNPLMPQQGADGPAPQIQPQGQGQQQTPQAPPTLDALRSAYDKLSDARKTLDQVRKHMDLLTKMGDTVTSDDVVKSAGHLVAAGLDPKAIASLLSTMPLQGEALAAWIANHDANVNQREQQLDQMREQIQHQMGLAAVKGLMASGQAQPQSQSPSLLSAPAQQPPNALAPQGMT